MGRVAAVADRGRQASKASAARTACCSRRTPAHKVYDAVTAAVAGPMLHIADATADRLVADGRSRVALLGTRFTMNEGHIRDRIEARGIALAPIEPGWVREVDRIIFEELAAGRVVRDSQRKLKT